MTPEKLNRSSESKRYQVKGPGKLMRWEDPPLPGAGGESAHMTFELFIDRLGDLDRR